MWSIHKQSGGHDRSQGLRMDGGCRRRPSCLCAWPKNLQKSLQKHLCWKQGFAILEHGCTLVRPSPRLSESGDRLHWSKNHPQQLRRRYPVPQATCSFAPLRRAGGNLGVEPILLAEILSLVIMSTILEERTSVRLRFLRPLIFKILH